MQVTLGTAMDWMGFALFLGGLLIEGLVVIGLLVLVFRIVKL